VRLAVAPLARSSILKKNNLNNQIFITLGEKGVEIKFHHDVQAWGSNGEVRTIRRKLHPGEKPKAVLGSAICVYWDTDIGYDYMISSKLKIHPRFIQSHGVTVL